MPGSFSLKEKVLNTLKTKNINIYQILILLILLCIYQYGSQKICSFSLYPDEFGYWASAANAVGYDWSEVASLGSYYSFGYSLILIPILRWAPDGVAAYRIAVFVNMLFMCGSVFLLQGICKKMFPETNKVQRTFIGGIAVLYPAWIFYMQMTMAEALLFFMFALVTYLFLWFIERPKVLTAALLAVSLIYIYCVHMRTVGVVIACVIACMVWGITRAGKRKQLLVMIGVLALMGGMALQLKNYTVLEVFSYAEDSTLAINDYGNQWGKFEQILTVKGMIQLLKEVIGKLYYLGISSFGLFYWALGWCMKEAVLLLKGILKKEGTALKQWGAVFLLLAVAGEVLICSIYMYRAGSVDCLVYGRYNELLVPVMMAVGAAVMLGSRHWISITASIAGITGFMTILLLNVIEAENRNGMRGYHAAGLSYLIREEDFNVFLFFRDTWLLGVGMILLVSLLVRFAREGTGTEWLLSGILLAEVIAGIQISNHYTYRVNVSNFENFIIVDAIKDSGKENDEIYYLNEGKPEFIDFLQMQLPEKPIHVIEEEILDEAAKPDGFLVTYVETELDERLQELYEKKVRGNTFCLYYDQDM